MTLRHDKVVEMAVRGKITQQEANMRLKKIEEEFQKKMTREAILDMMETGYLTVEEGEVELKKLEVRQKMEQIARRKKGRTAPEHDNDKRNNITLKAVSYTHLTLPTKRIV